MVIVLLCLLLCVYVRVVVQCVLATATILYHTCFNAYTLTLALLGLSAKAAYRYHHVVPWHGIEARDRTSRQNLAS